MKELFVDTEIIDLIFILWFILANAAKLVNNAMIMLIDNTRSFLTALFVTITQNRFSTAEADIVRVDKKQGLGNHA